MEGGREDGHEGKRWRKKRWRREGIKMREV